MYTGLFSIKIPSSTDFLIYVAEEAKVGDGGKMGGNCSKREMDGLFLFFETVFAVSCWERKREAGDGRGKGEGEANERGGRGEGDAR